MRASRVEADERLQRLIDAEEIRNLARRYAHCVWQSDSEGAASLFAEEGVMDTGDRPALEGREAIRETYSQTFAESDFKPFIHNHVLELHGDVATGTCYLDLKAYVDGCLWVGWGYYDDDYVRDGGVWYFKRRRLNMVHYGESASG
ncbi:MAG: hypothetical protein CL917_08965 [Deltaproteobacteria bacterium]|nr:hypothetical protein [Deltaproteobacteria bacterium]